jgi:hypothetical protein
MRDLNHNSIGHEADSTDIHGVGLTGLGLAVGVAIVFLLVYGIFQYLVHHPFMLASPNPMAETNEQQFPQSPRIEEHPASDLKELNMQEDRILSTYGWVDKNAGVVRIPIDQAVELQLTRGFPVRKEAGAK